MALEVVEMTAGHWSQVERIYAEGIATGNATFELEPPSQADFEAQHLPGLALVALDEARVIGWAALSPVSDRCVYGGVAENSVYVAEAARGRGAGRLVLGSLIERAEQAGIWTVQTGIFPENTASLALHHACGFRTVGVRERLGRHHGSWRDVLLLERRSARIV